MCELLVIELSDWLVDIEMDIDDLVIIFYMLGMIGVLKGVMLLYGNVCLIVYVFNYFCGMNLGDCILLFVFLFYCFG